MSLPIETQRLLLRRYEDRDLPDILEYSLNANFWLARNLDWPVSEEGVRNYWEAQRDIHLDQDPKWFSLVIELKAQEKVIGHAGIGISKIGNHRQGMVGWLLGCDYQGKGLATEAARALMTLGFEHLRLHRISARTGRDNERSWKLMERLGMRREAHFRESHVVEGEWRDEFVYAVLADEWRQKHRKKISSE
jgi:RimJ/RimL family protein N-acetyltransferase